MSDMQLSGYALTYDPYPVFGGPNDGGWTEQVDRAALERAVAETPRLPVRIGDEVVGEADLSVDDTGLKVNATLSTSYSFRVKDQRWSDKAERLIQALSLTEIGINIPSN